MERTLCAALPARLAAGPAHSATPIELFAWVTRARRLGGLTFLVLRDRSGICQAVLEGTAPIPPREALVRLRGTPRPEPRAPGGVEVAAHDIEVLAAPAETPPLPLHQPEMAASLETVLDHRPVALRHPKARAVFSVQAALLRGFRRALDARGFTEVHTPKLVGTATEGGAAVFAVDYFGRRAYLAQSPQLYKQILVGAGFERVYEVAPVYRAESHDTARHLNEYVSLDLETELFAGGGTAPLIALERDLLAAMFAQVEADCPGAARLPDPARAEVLTLAEALRVTGRAVMDPEAERLLAQRVGEMVFVTEWPAEQRPFYAMEEGTATASFDLILRGLEVTTGGQREHRHAHLGAAMRRRKMSPEGFSFYMEAFALGMPPHGGFAIGLERLTARLLGLPNVRMASLFPRDRHRLAP